MKPPVDDPEDTGFGETTTLARPQFVPAPTGSFVIEVLDGPNRGQKIPIDVQTPSRLLVGKSPACHLLLTDPEVSRRHCAFEVCGRELCVTDLGSTNGTRVNDTRIKEAYLRGGERVFLGNTVLGIQISASKSPAVPMGPDHFGRVLGGSTAMRRLYPLCERLAKSDIPVLIEGETGTGKEQLAEALHERSARAGAPFVVLDCTALAPNLVESELFGHERGAFTGSVTMHKGVFERARGSTLFIDEVGDLPLALQPKFLRAIERAEITRLGGESPIQVNTRLIFATHRNLDHEVHAGRFREDLFHRIAVARVELPPLRSRAGDVALLACHFCAGFGADPALLPDDLLRSWADYDWPGNVRELRNAVLRWLALGQVGQEPSEQHATPEHARKEFAGIRLEGDTIARILALDLPLAEARQRLSEELERRYVEHLLERHGDNVTRAAAAAGISRRHLHHLKAKMGA